MPANGNQKGHVRIVSASRATGSKHQTFILRPLTQAVALAFCSLALCAVLPQQAMAQASATQSANERQTYNIPAGPLAPALRSLASAANIALAFTAEQANGKTSNPVRGRFTPQEALTVLLAHTGLQAVQLDNGGYVLRVVSVPAIEAVLPTVTASGHLEVADGPILGYVCLLYTSPSPRD